VLAADISALPVSVLVCLSLFGRCRIWYRRLRRYVNS